MQNPKSRTTKKLLPLLHIYLQETFLEKLISGVNICWTFPPPKDTCRENIFSNILRLDFSWLHSYFFYSSETRQEYLNLTMKLKFGCCIRGETHYQESIFFQMWMAIVWKSSHTLNNYVFFIQAFRARDWNNLSKNTWKLFLKMVTFSQYFGIVTQLLKQSFIAECSFNIFT